MEIKPVKLIVTVMQDHEKIGVQRKQGSIKWLQTKVFPLLQCLFWRILTLTDGFRL